VQLEDRITIATPEGIELQIVLAGAASRFIACVIDLLLQLVLVVLAAVAALGLLGGGLGTALFAMASFAALYLYDVLFEVLASGRTPGKRVTHLRVVRARGTPVDLPASAIRNLLRFIDMLPTAYLVGLVSIVMTRHNQRLGDLAAGTLVIRDATRRKPAAATEAPETTRAQGAIDSSGWDVSAVSVDELAAVRRFLERRESLDRGARQALAHRLAHGLRTKVAGAPPDLSAEDFLQELARVKASR
jgi:uncharacterized RDD family membrane protein YckC